MNGKPLIEHFHEQTFTQLESQYKVKLNDKTKKLIRGATETCWGSIGAALMFYYMNEMPCPAEYAFEMAKNWIKEHGGPEIQ